MRVHWSPAAAADFERIVQHIREQNDPAALRIARLIYQSAAGLKSFPNRGRLGRVEGTRELVLSPLPFILIYRVKADFVEIANVLHGAQQWPPRP
ncbi:MAG: type II toxin-antitoxin system RelE/ParE family toxin [Acidobacteriia bacterium]|nr:type II toxin-antitoxin system RelE/ParE family toxin [Terriglobia bacterium]